MPEPCSLRMLEIVRAWFAEEAATFPVVGLDEREFTTGYLPKVGVPELYVVAVEPLSLFERESDGGVKEPIGVALRGYVQAPADAVPEGESDAVPVVPAVSTTRERFLQAVLTRLHQVTGTEALIERLITDVADHQGNGCHEFKQVAPALRDRGEHAPLGWFVIPCEATLHYRDGSF